jgi:hypothetical protein
VYPTKTFVPLVSKPVIAVPGEPVVTEVQVGVAANGFVLYFTVALSATYTYSVPPEDLTVHINKLVEAEDKDNLVA